MISLNCLKFLFSVRYSRLYQVTHKKNEILSSNPSIQICINRVNNRLMFKVINRYRLDLQKREMMKLCGSTKRPIHVKKVGYTSIFFFFYFFWHLFVKLKNNCLLKKMLKQVNKNCKNFNIYSFVFFFFLNKKAPQDITILHLCTKYLDDMIYSYVA